MDPKPHPAVPQHCTNGTAETPSCAGATSQAACTAKKFGGEFCQYTPPVSGCTGDAACTQGAAKANNTACAATSYGGRACRVEH